ncbi:MAG: hypothetical protein EOO54_13300 [Haliea sp.]|nr:MAG: hypothetical protein EOO54_13300 [Haliea sp.]
MTNDSLAFRIGAASLLALCALATQAHAQVYRCGDSGLYTDKPCDDARAVDLRSNLLDAGPKSAPVTESDQPSQPLILNNISRVVNTPPSGPSTVWQNSDSRQAAQPGRVSPPPPTSSPSYYPPR